MSRLLTTRRRILRRSFYARPTLEVARELLGCRLVRRLPGGRRLAGAIVETEAYIGEEDLACHAAAGHTARNAVMFGPAGHAYVYMIYGMHFMLNVVTERASVPGAVLIRALEPLEGLRQMAERRGADGIDEGSPPRVRARLTSGPGRLSQALGIDLSLNGIDLCDGELAIERGHEPDAVETTRRVGVEYAGAWSLRPWRFVIAGNPFVSRVPPPSTATATARRRRSQRRAPSLRDIPL